MNQQTGKKAGGESRARWIAAGFLGAFAASILTVIWTGLMVEGRPEEFDSGFRSVTMTTGETRSIELIFDSPIAHAEAELRIELPDALEPADGSTEAAVRRLVELAPGTNVFTVIVRARAEGSGYLQARLSDDGPVALERVFVTVEPADSI
jgi:hypothetical protein